MARVRTFIAVNVTDEIQIAGERIIDTLRQSTHGARWVRRQNIHLTLKFLGDVDERELYSVCRNAAEAVQAAPSFLLLCRSLGAFPSASRPSTIWMGVDDRDGQLARLQQQVEVSMAALGFPAERRKYHGHITLGRIRSGRGSPELHSLIEKNTETDFGLLPVGELTVYRSELNRDGPNYTVVGRCPLTSNS